MIYTAEQRGTTPEKHFHPKRYLFDIGIGRQLREAALPHFSLLNAADSLRRQSVGGVIENVVANRLTSRYGDVTGWKKSSSGSEIDFVIKRGPRRVPVECKAALKVKNSHLYGVLDFLKIHKIRIGILVGLAPFEIRTLSNHEKVLILPVYLLDSMDEILDQIEKIP